MAPIEAAHFSVNQGDVQSKLVARPLLLSVLFAAHCIRSERQRGTPRPKRLSTASP
jgi:hypothetical protein